jgi:ABC-2 type transport system permease protein
MTDPALSDPPPPDPALPDPSTATPAGGSVIHDLGYRPYTGPRLAPPAIARSLVVTGLRNAFGLGRSGRSKVLPFVLLAFNLMPALIIGGVMVFVGLDRLPIGYAQYASTTQVLLGIFVASQAPVLFSRDLRHGTIALYLARPLPAAAYAVSRWASLLGATLVFLLSPILLLYAVSLLGELDVTDQTRDAGIAIGLAVLLAMSLAGVAGVIASWSTRRGFAVVATIAVLLIGNGIVTAIQGISQEVGKPLVGEVAELFSPYSLYRGLMSMWTGFDAPTPPTGVVMQTAYVVVFVALAGGCLATLVHRYRTVASA